MTVRLYQPADASAVAKLSAACTRAESDFVLNPMWETVDEFVAEFARHAIDPERHLLVSDSDGEVVGISGFLNEYGARAGGLFCPVVERGERGRGVGGELLRAALELGRDQLGLRLATAGIGTRNRGGYSLLTAHGFRPVRQHFLMRCDEKPDDTPAALEGLEFRAASPDDLAAIHAIYESCGFEPRTPEQMAEYVADGRHAHAVARRNGEVKAFAELETHWPRRNWVAYVGVAREMRDRGIGSSLVGWTLARQFEAGCQQGLLLLSPANRSAIRAYEKVGFRRVRSFDVLEKVL
jgi:ribosomal protein S18 acetylase RimI-like enzyme